MIRDPYQRKYYEQNGPRLRAATTNRNRLVRYGVTSEQYEALRDAANNVCALCGETKAKLEYDHDHETGAFRGFLCGDCNRGLGLFREDPERLAKAIEYLRRHNA